MERYNAKAAEKKWQEEWEKERTYLTSEDKDKEKYYVLENVSLPFWQNSYGPCSKLYHGRRSCQVQTTQGF